jgi:predicted nucleotidyltransferase
MRVEIIRQLKVLEKDKNIRFIFACESGSRAWGFPSPNSDYDVRCIYVHPKDWYLTIQTQKDSFEAMLEGDLDIGGWDLRKTLGLVNRSNPTVWEWLDSPIIYQELPLFKSKMLEVSKSFFSPVTGFHHYYSSAKRSIDKVEHSGVLKIKRYFYILRPLLAATWVCRKKTMPPMTFTGLLDLVPPSEARTALGTLVTLKASVPESHVIKPIPVIEEFIKSLRSECESSSSEISSSKGDIKDLDAFFRGSL